MLQETHSDPNCEKIWKNEWGGEIIFSHGTTSARGIAVLIAKNSNMLVKNVYRDTEGRLIILDLEQNEQKLCIAAIYAPNEDKPSFFSTIGEILKDRSEHKIIIGDYNLVLNVEQDRENTYNNNNRAKEEVENLMEQYCLRDIWRIQNGDRREFSWFKKHAYPIKASRIDLALVSGGLDQKIKNSLYLSSIKTDHRGLYLAVDLDPFERGQGFWKLNTTMLYEKEYVEKINEEIRKTIDICQKDNARVTWEKLKKRVKKLSIQYARNRTSMEKLVIAQLSEKVNDYEANQPLNDRENTVLEDTKKELEEKIFDRTKGVMFRSKAKWYEEGERNTKYFYSLEKAKYNAKTCFKIFNSQGSEITQPQEILQEQKKFYEELYRKDENVNFNMENTFEIFVPQDIKSQQEKQLNQEDLASALKSMKNNRTPGEDGLPADFYKVFWNYIKQPFYNMVIECYQEQMLHQTARQGILNLIPKANKDTRYIKNLRPITLLNCDYKIIEKAIANKMLPALHTIIAKDQRGFMKDRRISVNIRKMLDIIHHAEQEDLEAVVLSLDFVKCFDKCSFDILHGSLDFFKFGEVVKEWTRILYKSFSVKIQNNGHFSSWIDIEKGVHQGGCCSSVYFLVIAEILALALRQNDEIEGITIADIRNLLNQFADDMDIFSICNEKSLKAIHKELADFKAQSGFTVSYDKTTLYRIGSLRHSNAQMYGIDEFVWSKEDINVLGVNISHENIIQKNYDEIMQKVKKTLNTWHNRDLSLIGKVQVVNTLVASLFVYKMMVLPRIPSHVVRNFDNIVREYIWKWKKIKNFIPNTAK